MEVAGIFKELGSASKDKVWVIDKAVYGLTTRRAEPVADRGGRVQFEA